MPRSRHAPGLPGLLLALALAACSAPPWIEDGLPVGLVSPEGVASPALVRVDTAAGAPVRAGEAVVAFPEADEGRASVLFGDEELRCVGAYRIVAGVEGYARGYEGGVVFDCDGRFWSGYFIALDYGYGSARLRSAGGTEVRAVFGADVDPDLATGPVFESLWEDRPVTVPADWTEVE